MRNMIPDEINDILSDKLGSKRVYTTNGWGIGAHNFLVKPLIEEQHLHNKTGIYFVFYLSSNETMAQEEIQKIRTEINSLRDNTYKRIDTEFVENFINFDNKKVLIVWVVSTDVRNKFIDFLQNQSENNKTEKSLEVREHTPAAEPSPRSNSSNIRLAQKRTTIARVGEIFKIATTSPVLSKEMIGLLKFLIDEPLGIKNLTQLTSYEDKKKFKEDLLFPALEQGLVESTIQHPIQNRKYRLTEKGKAVLKE